MRIFGEWLRRLQYLIHRGQYEEELRREMETHREMMGEPRRFGNSLRLREESRDAWGWNWLDNVAKDLLYGLRQLRKAPTLTLLAVVTLALGIGAITTFSSLLKAALFAELPVRNPGELRQKVWSLRAAPGFSQRGSSNFSYPVYRYVQMHTTGFSEVACWSAATSVNLRAGEDLTRVSAQFVSGNFFEAVGVGLSMGRAISVEDDAPNATPVAVLSYGAWQRLFGGESDVLGRTVTVNGAPFVVIGVITSSDFPDTPLERWIADLTIPVSQYRSTQINFAPANAEVPCRIIGRMGTGISRERAQQEGQELLRQAYVTNPPSINGRQLDGGQKPYVGLRGLRGIDQQEASGIPTILAFVLLFGALLAIVCSNIAGMMLARGAARRGEVATRLALGAGRRRVVRQLLTESFLLAGLGGGTALCLCLIAKSFIPWPFVLDLPILAITAGISCVTGLLFGLAPALIATRMSLTSAMKQASPGSLGAAFRGSNILIAIQVALSFLLLVATGLQVRSLSHLLAPSNFEPERVLIVQAHPRSSGYTAERVHGYFEEAVRRVEGLPGVRSVTVSSGNGISSRVSPGNVTAIVDYVAPRFFETMNIRVLLGRDIAWTDRKGAPLVVVVNETLVRTMFAGTTPLGKTLRLRAGPAEIVGVVADSNNSVGDAYRFGQSVQPSIYVPFQQQVDGLWGSMTLSARVTADPATLVSAVRRSVRDVDLNVVVDPAQTQSSQRSFGIRERGLVVGILSAAGFIALLEVAFGIYGTLSFFVGMRTPEIGLRMALGAQRSDVIRMVLRKSLTSVGIGTLAGLIGAPILVRALDSGRFLVGSVRASDQLAITGVAFLLLVFALSTSLAPARRASRVAPMQALRHE